MAIGNCDCCDASDVTVTRLWVTGIETFACAVCRCDEGDPDDLQAEIDRLRPKAETGAQWAYISALEAMIANHGQFGVGA